MASEQENLHANEMREWLQAWVKRTSQRRVAEALGVNRDPLRRALRGTGEVTGVVREAVVRYARSRGMQVIEPDTSSSIGKLEDDSGSGDDAGSDANKGKKGGSGPSDERSENGLTGAKADGERGEPPAENDDKTPDSPEHAADAPEDIAGEVPPGAARQPRDAARDKGVSGLLGKIENALTPAELASVVGAPVLAELPMEAALSGARALARGWQWVRDPAPTGLHGDALYYLHTREDVRFADEGAKRVAFAADTGMFECGLTGAELRYGVHPRDRQKRYAVERHEDRGLLIGIRMAALVPERPYPDERWFFGSEGQAIDGEWQSSAADVIAARRKLTVMSDSFSEASSEKRLTPWQLALRNEQMRVELQMINSHYGLTIGEHVNGDRTWAPSTRLGIETRWRYAEIALNESAIQDALRRHRRMSVLLWLPRLILGRLISPSEGELCGEVCGDKDWSSATPPSCVAALVPPVSPPSTSTTSWGAPPSASAPAASQPSPSPASTSNSGTSRASSSNSPSIACSEAPAATRSTSTSPPTTSTGPSNSASTPSRSATPSTTRRA